MDLRGGDSWGVAVPNLSKGKVTVRKGLGDIVVGCDLSGLSAHPHFSAHTRRKSCGDVTVENAHPFRFGNLVGAHNGSVSNHDELNKKNGTDYAVDSMQVFHYLHHHINDDQRMKEVEGYGAIWWALDHAPNRTYLLRWNSGQLLCQRWKFGEGDQAWQGVVWASTLLALDTAARKIGCRSVTTVHLEEGKAFLVEEGEVYQTQLRPGFSAVARRWGGTLNSAGHYENGTSGTAGSFVKTKCQIKECDCKKEAADPAHQGLKRCTKLIFSHCDYREWAATGNEPHTLREKTPRMYCDDPTHSCRMVHSMQSCLYVCSRLHPAEPDYDPKCKRLPLAHPIDKCDIPACDHREVAWDGHAKRVVCAKLAIGHPSRVHFAKFGGLMDEGGKLHKEVAEPLAVEPWETMCDVESGECNCNVQADHPKIGYAVCARLVPGHELFNPNARPCWLDSGTDINADDFTAERHEALRRAYHLELSSLKAKSKGSTKPSKGSLDIIECDAAGCNCDVSGYAAHLGKLACNRLVKSSPSYDPNAKPFFDDPEEDDEEDEFTEDCVGRCCNCREISQLNSDDLCHECKMAGVKGGLVTQPLNIDADDECPDDIDADDTQVTPAENTPAADTKKVGVPPPSGLGDDELGEAGFLDKCLADSIAKAKSHLPEDDDAVWDRLALLNF